MKTRYSLLTWLVIISMTLALLGPLSSAASPARPDSWVSECIDCPKSVSDLTDRSLQLDTAGRAHLAYGGDHLYYAWRDAGSPTWHSETVDPSVGVGAFASLALDVNDYPHIAYQDSIHGDLKYAYQDALGWHIETVDSDGDKGYYASLALDQDGYPHVSYTYGMGSLYYAHKDAAGWHLDNPDSGIEVEDTSLAVDNAGRPHIAYADSTHGELRHAYWTGTAWTVATLRDAEYTGDSVSLAIDIHDVAHVTFYDESGYPVGALKYYSGGSTSTVDSGADAWFAYSSLAIDNLGRPHATYRDGLDQDVKYAYRDGGGWHVSVVDGGDDAGQFTSLALDSGGRPHVAYMAGSTIKYAYRDANLAWHFEVVDETGNPGQSAAPLALDSTGQAHVAYQDAALNYDLKYARRAAGSAGWEVETVDSAGDVGRCASLAVDGAGNPHIGYGDVTSGVVKYAYKSGLAEAWQVETVGAASGNGLSLALDAGGGPHLAYGGPAALMYAYRDGSGWHAQPVTGAESCSLDPALAMDQIGQPHILCIQYGYPNSLLNYVYRDAGLTWHVELLAELLYIGGEPALRLDGSDSPRVAYVDWNEAANDYEVVYAYRDDSTWHTEVVGGEGTTPALAIDTAGQPHIAYGHHYAVREADSTWRSETLPGQPVYARSLALDASDRPHLVISNGYQLKYAWFFHAGYAVYLPWVARGR